MFDSADPTRVLDELALVGAEHMEDADLLEALRAARAVIASSHGLLLVAVAELRQRAQEAHADLVAARRGRRLTRAERGSAPAGAEEVDRFAAADVAVALGLSQGSAMATQTLAVDLSSRFPRTLDALVAGRLDRSHAEAVSEAAVGLDAGGCAVLEADLLPRVVPDAGEGPVELPDVLDEHGRPLVVMGGPARDGAVVCSFTRPQVAGRARRAVMRVDRAAVRRRAEAARARRGVRSWAVEDAMGVLQVTGPAATIAAAWARVDAVARERHDLARAALRELELREGGEQAAPPGQPGQASPEQLLPTLDNLRADTVLEWLAGTHDLRERPSPRVQVHVDLTLPLSSLAAEPAQGAGEAGGGGRGGDAVPWGCHEPAEVVGVGPISVDEARDLLADARWRLLVPVPPGTRDDAGAGADPEAPGPCRTHQEEGPGPYELPARLARAVRSRDVTCRFPGCARAARRCDADHTIPHPRGPSALCNNACLCRFHHRLKHRGGWRVEQLPGGVMRWTSPSGATATTRPPSQEGAAGSPPSAQPRSLQRPSDQRPSDQRPSDLRPSDLRPSDQRPSDQRPSDQRPSDQRPSDNPLVGRGLRDVELDTGPDAADEPPWARHAGP
ncbi:HNH endonuclease signature motif containing protein [Aquipuribacter sp. SD81]|uniref:HNH endonuclease signature motif containing protein n=1 Tax=Aquipuribacter sp. SD81 TaxID=3127703 RepID=UPI00301A7783